MTNIVEKRTSPIGIRVTPTMKAALESAAAQDHRPVASLIEKVMLEWLRERGHLPAPDQQQKT